MKERTYWIDWAKAIAIFAVVLCHNVGDNPPTWLGIVNMIGCSFHVSLFYFISGYLFRIKENNFVAFIKGSIYTLIVPYISFNLISAAILWKLQPYEAWKDSLLEFVKCGSFSFAGPAWFLIALFLIRLTVYWLSFIHNEYTKWILIILLSAFPMLISFTLWFGISQAMVGLVFFIVGNYSKKYQIVDRYLQINTFLRYLIPIALLCVLFIPIPFDTTLLPARGECSLLGYVKTMLCVLMALSFCLLLRDVRSRIVEIISRGCIVIMGLHMTIVQVLWVVEGHLPLSLQWTCEAPGITLTAFFLSIITAMLMMKYVPVLIGNRK